MIILMCWQQIGYMMIIYIAGLQNVPGDLLEAAAIDGATGAQALFRVKLPMVMPSITICTFLTPVSYTHLHAGFDHGGKVQHIHIFVV